MFVASVALTYAAWEAFVEDIAVELSEFLADNVSEAMVPEDVRKAIEDVKPTPWELTIHPGWRELWKARVRARAKGDANASEYGMNSARVKQIILLFRTVGVDFFRDISQADKDMLEKLVTARGGVVHSASAPEDFKKSVAKGYRDLVEAMAVKATASLREQATTLVGTAPWSDDS